MKKITHQIYLLFVAYVAFFSLPVFSGDRVLEFYSKNAFCTDESGMTTLGIAILRSSSSCLMAYGLGQSTKIEPVSCETIANSGMFFYGIYSGYFGINQDHLNSLLKNTAIQFLLTRLFVSVVSNFSDKNYKVVSLHTGMSILCWIKKFSYHLGSKGDIKSELSPHQHRAGTTASISVFSFLFKTLYSLDDTGGFFLLTFSSLRLGEFIGIVLKNLSLFSLQTDSYPISENDFSNSEKKDEFILL